MSEEGFSASKVLTIVLVAVGGLVTTGVIAIVTMLNTTGNRLTSIETVMSQNKEERVQQVRDLRDQDNDLRERVEQLERRAYRTGS